MVMFGPEKYESKIENLRKRLNMASKFKELDRLPIFMSVGEGFFCERFGYSVKDY